MIRTDLQNGRSMIEMLGVLAIIGILTVGGFSLVSKATTENRINNVIDEVSSLSHRVRSIFREYVFTKKPATGADFTDYVAEARAFPDVLTYDDSDCSGGFIDDEEVCIKIKYEKKGTDADSEIHYFIMELSNLDDEVCMGLANATWGTAATNGFLGIGFEYVSGSKPAGLIDLSTATEKCTGDNTTLYLKFK